MRHRVQALLILCGLAACVGVSADLQQVNMGISGQNLSALYRQANMVPVPAPTVNPCKSIDPQCIDCANNVCTACNIIFTLDDATKKCVCPDGQQLAQDGTTCINIGLVNVGRFLYNNTVVQDGLVKATMNAVQHNKAVDSFVATTAKSAASVLQAGQNSIKSRASKVLASALAPAVQPAEFVAAPKEPQPESAPAPEADAGAAVAGQPLPSGPALAPQDAAYAKLVAEGRAQQAQEVQTARAKILQASGLAPAQAIAPTVGSALQQVAAAQQLQQQPSQAAQQQPDQAQAAGTPSGLNPISALVSQAGGLLQSYLPSLGRRLLKE